MRTIPPIKSCGPLCPFHDNGFCRATNQPTSSRSLPFFPDFCVLKDIPEPKMYPWPMALGPGKED